MAKIPAFSLIETLPTGRVQHPDLGAVIARAVDILAGRPWVPVLAVAAYPTFDSTPIVNLWTEPHQRPAHGPNLEWACAIVLGDAVPLSDLERGLQIATGHTATPAIRHPRSSSEPAASDSARQNGAAA